MENEEESQKVFDELLTDTLFETIASQVTITNKPVSKEAFEAEIAALRKSFDGPEPESEPATDEPTDAEVA
jgi:hypothetical protein